MSYLILDISTAPLPQAAEWLTTEPITAPANYKDQAKIDAYIEDKRRSLLESAALDADLCQITGWGMWSDRDPRPCSLVTNGDTQKERIYLEVIAGMIDEFDPTIVTYNGFKFDLPFLMRRAMYLEVDFPEINLDRYRSNHVDVWDRLTYHGAISGHPLSFYARRFGWTDVSKPLTGAEEAQVLQSGRWDDLKASILHDVTVLGRLAKRFGFIQAEQPEPVI